MGRWCLRKNLDAKTRLVLDQAAQAD